MRKMRNNTKLAMTTTNLPNLDSFRGRNSRDKQDGQYDADDCEETELPLLLASIKRAVSSSTITASAITNSSSAERGLSLLLNVA